jgi:mono/diheme cytochrome c family protein
MYEAPRVNYGTLTRSYANVRDHVFKQHCSSCHFGAEAYAPRLDLYETASAQAGEILRAVEGGTMPPSAPLTQRQAEAVAFLRSWVAEGASR